MRRPRHPERAHPAGGFGRAFGRFPQGLGRRALILSRPDKAEWFASMARAGVPMFNDVEEMAEAAGLLARYPALRKAARVGTLPTGVFHGRDPRSGENLDSPMISVSAALLHFCHFWLDMAEMSGSIDGKRAIAGSAGLRGPVSSQSASGVT